MSDNRQSFSDRNSWHFAVAKSFPAARAATKVLVEARIVDGAEIAEWDFLTNTGWMRSIVVPQAVPATDGHAGYLSEGGRASWYVCEANPDNSFTAVDAKAYPSKDAAYASPVFRRDNGSRDIIAVHGVLGADKKTVTPADLSEAARGGAATTFFEGSLDDFKAAVKAAHPDAVFTSPGKMGVEARVGKEVVGHVGELSGKKAGVWRGGYRAELRGDKSLTEGKAKVLNEGRGDKASVSSIDWSIGNGDWTVAKAEGRRIFADYNKSGNTDAVLAVKTAASAAQKSGSYLGAVLLGLANDYFESRH